MQIFKMNWLISVNILLVSILPLIASSYIDTAYHDIPPVVVRESPNITPVGVMVDVTNDLSYRILEQHSIANRNNFAFSPTSLISVMIALYEGSQGGGATEIYNVLKLPWNRDLVRIGYRDVHRRLRKYFFDQENPLTGLSLSKENVTIVPEYEDILKFYGYNLESDMHPFNERGEATTERTSTSTSTTTTESTTSTSESTTSTSESTTSTSESTSSSTVPTIKLTEIMPTEFSTSSTSTAKSTDISPTETTTPSILTTKMPETVLTTLAPSPPTTIPPILDSTTVVAPEPSTTLMETTMSSVSELNPIEHNEDTTILAESTDVPEETTEMPHEETTVTDSTDEAATTATTISEDTTTEPLTTTVKPARLVSTIDPTNVIFPLTRRRKQPSAARKARSQDRVKRQFPIGFNDPPFTITVTPIHPAFPNIQFIPINNNGNDFNGFYQPKNEVAINKKEIHHIFYLNNQESIQARYKVYNSILRFNYIQNIRSSVLELELDTKDYNLLIMIPDYEYGLDFLLENLKLAPSLRVIRQEMRPRWVQAIVPDFKLKGNIFLTNDLQNMGILEVFEPARADFSPMTNEPNIYVRHIEQSVNVHLRTRPADQLKRNVGPYNRPIEVSINHPFLFFIVDRELDVAIMAGRVLNPLNVRIH